MASCNIASAASGFVLTHNVTSNTNSGGRSNMLSFPFKNNNSRLVVRSAEEGAAPPTTTTAPPEGQAAKPKPPPVGPKRGTKVSTILLVSFHYSYRCLPIKLECESASNIS
jgi:photosystem I subunit 4